MSNEMLVGILRSHGASFDNATIEACLEDEYFRTWTKLHLTEDTVLSLDELELYDALQSSGAAERLEAAADGSSPVLPVREALLRSAVESLEGSTMAISRQTDLVQHQLDAVARLVKTAEQASDSRAKFEAQHLQQWESRRDNLGVGVTQLSRRLGDRVAELEQQAKGTQGYAQQMVDGLCRTDDKLLGSLQKLGWALAGPDDADEQQTIGQLRDICLRLIKHTVESIRTRLDRVYLEAVEATAATSGSSAGDRGGGNGGGDPDAVAALQDELESLYAEILPVAQMSVDQQYLDPALKSISRKNGRNAARSLLALDYINECLDYLLEQISLLSERIQTSNSHQAATSSIVAMARSEIAVPTATARRPDERRYSLTSSPVRRLRSGYGQPAAAASPVRRRRRSSGLGMMGGDLSPLEQLLQSLSVTLPEPGDFNDDVGGGPGSPGSNGSVASIANALSLHTTLTDRQAKADGVAGNVQEAFEADTSAHLADGRRALWMARESVLAESEFGAVQLLDPEIDGSIAVMAHEVGGIRERLEEVAKELGAVRKGSAKRDRLVARWG